jgi:dolichyl-phosphate beta-glucosyltransferase
MNHAGPEVVIVVPCYNEEQRLDVERFRALSAREPGIGFLFVDDGSTDGTYERLRELAATAPTAIRVLKLEFNAGKGEAVRRGILTAWESAPRFIGYWDADLATPLEAIASFREALQLRPDLEMVVGSRVQLLGHSIVRKTWRHYTGRVFATFASLILDLEVYDTQCGAKLFRTSERMKTVFECPFTTRWVFDVEILARLAQVNAGSALLPVRDVVLEFPLMQWCDVTGSKLRYRDFLRAGLDLLRIYRRYPTRSRRRRMDIREDGR